MQTTTTKVLTLTTTVAAACIVLQTCISRVVSVLCPPLAVQKYCHMSPCCFFQRKACGYEAVLSKCNKCKVLLCFIPFFCFTHNVGCFGCSRITRKHDAREYSQSVNGPFLALYFSIFNCRCRVHERRPVAHANEMFSNVQSTSELTSG